MESSQPPGAAVREPSYPTADPEKRIALMYPTQRRHFVAMLGEFIGTTLFLWFAFSGAQVVNSVVPAENPPPAAVASRLLYIALAFGFSLMVNVWVFYRISGGLFNPAVRISAIHEYSEKLTHTLSWLRLPSLS